MCLVMYTFRATGGLSHLLWLRKEVHSAAAFRLIVVCQSRRLGVVISVVAAHQLLRVCIQICARSEPCRNLTTTHPAVQEHLMPYLNRTSEL